MKELLNTFIHKHTYNFIKVYNKNIGVGSISSFSRKKLEWNNSFFAKNDGITLIALVVTIVVLLILAGVSINLVLGNNGVITKTEKAKMKTELASYLEELNLYKTDKVIENTGFKESTLSAGQDNLYYNTQPEGETGSIKTIITTIDDSYIDKIQIIRGQLVCNVENKEEIEIVESLGISANPYDITDEGILESSNKNLLLIDEDGTLIIPEGIVSIGEGAFAQEGLKTIILPKSLKKIEKNAFANNTTLEKVVFADGCNLGSIGESAFEKCTALKEIKIPDTTYSMGYFAFRHCTSLTEIIIPKSLKTTYATFAGCNLNKITLQEGLQTIGDSCFNNCNISTIKIPSTVTTISTTAFVKCNNLESFDLSENNNFIYESGMLMTKAKDDILFVSPKYLKSITQFTIPEGVKKFSTNIEDYTNINKLIIATSTTKIIPHNLPNSLSSIEVKSGNTVYTTNNANTILYLNNTTIEACCIKDVEVTIPEGTTQINTFSFRFATNMTKINLPNSLTTVETYFYGWSTKLKTINIGKNITSLHPHFLGNATNITVTVDKDNPNYTIDNLFLYNKDKTVLLRVFDGKSESITVNSTVKTIGKEAFYGLPNIKEVIISEGVEQIESNVFCYCTNLQKVVIPSTVKTIVTNCFFDNTPQLSEIIINNKAGAIAGAPWGAIRGERSITYLK